MGTNAKIALIVLMVGVVASILVWHLSEQDQTPPPASASSTSDVMTGAMGGPDALSPELRDSRPSGALTVADPTPSGASPAPAVGTGGPIATGGAPSGAPAAPGGSPASPAAPVQTPPPAAGPTQTTPVPPAGRPTIDTRAPAAPQTPGALGAPRAPAVEPQFPARPYEPFPTIEREKAAAGKTHTVVEGDSLWTIAVKYYKDGTKLDRIRDANHGKIGEGDLLRVKTVLTIPEIEPTPGTHPREGAAEQPVGPDECRVESGDTLESIAKKKYGKPYLWQEIAKANEGVLRDGPDHLKVGMILRIPPAPEAGAHASRPPREIDAPIPPEFQGRQTYKIVSGDSLWKIAKKTLGDGTKWQKIYKANQDRIDPEHLKVGQVIVLPDEGSTTTPLERPRESNEVRPGGGLAPIPTGAPAPWTPTPPAPTPGGTPPPTTPAPR